MLYGDHANSMQNHQGRINSTFSSMNMTFSNLSPNDMCYSANCNRASLWCDFNHENRSIFRFFMFPDSITLVWIVIFNTFPSTVFINWEQRKSQLKPSFWYNTVHRRSWSLVPYIWTWYSFEIFTTNQTSSIRCFPFLMQLQFQKRTYILLSFSRFLIPLHLIINSTMLFWINATITTWWSSKTQKSFECTTLRHFVKFTWKQFSA